MRILYFHSPQPLTALAESCFTLTPKVFLSSPSDLYLEIGATQKCFGGEAPLLHRAEQLAESFVGMQRRLVLTDRPEWARAFAEQKDILLSPTKSLAALQKLPIERLVEIGDPLKVEALSRERNQLVGFMKQVGLRTLGDFLALPISAVHRRFGKQGEILQDWAAGRRELCLTPFSPQDPIRESMDAEDLLCLDSLLFRLRQALVRIETRLKGRGQAVKTMRLTFDLESHSPTVKILELMEEMQEAQALLRVLREFLLGFHWESPLVRLEIEIADTLPYLPGQLSLLDDSQNKFHDLAQYVAKLRVRLGDTQVGFAQLKSSHLPERSYQLTWPPPPPPEKRVLFPKRPLFLFTPPKPFHPGGWELFPSENLFAEWWEPGGCREYFIARGAHECLWIYRDTLKGEWFVHGTFD